MASGNGDDRESRLRGAMMDWQNGPPAYMDQEVPYDEDDFRGEIGGSQRRKKPSQVIVPGALPFQGWQPINAADLPRREWVYGKHYIRKFCSVTVGPGGLGKSTLILAECIAIATGRSILGVPVHSRQRVVYYNAEDPKDEIDRRVLAICKLHKIPQEELVGWLWTASGRDTDLILAEGLEGDIVEPVFALMDKWQEEWGAAVFAFDPLANMTESPETNEVFRRLGKRFSRFADKHNCSIEIVHHTRKLNGRDAEVEDSRGGGALIGAVRSARVLNPMSPDEAARAGMDTHIDHFRIDAAGKNNMARPSPHADWYQRVGVELANGDHVAAVQSWYWPDAFEGVTADDARRVQLAIIARGDDNPPREHVSSNDWVGHLIAKVLGRTLEERSDRAKIQAMVKAWLASGVLETTEVRDPRQARDVKCIKAGSNNPAAQPGPA